MTEPVFDDVPGDIARDRWGRPMVVPPTGGKAVPYTRCTTYVSCLEDTYNLSKWQKRMVAVGLVQRPDLLLKASSLGMPPEDESAARKWKAQMDDTCESATEAAQASASATIGTALHSLTERIDRGLDVGVIPDSYKPHLKAYEAATSAFTAVHIERFSVNDDLQIGGTPDRVLRIDGHDKLIIGDVKTGSVEYGVGKMAMQLAVYAHSQLYNHETGARTPLGDVDLQRGLIIALNAKTGLCDLIWIDLQAGWEAVQLCRQVRAWRARKDLSKPYSLEQSALPMSPTVAQEQARDLTVEAQTALVIAINSAASNDDLIRLWTAAGTAWTPQHTELASARKAALAQRHLTSVS